MSALLLKGFILIQASLGCAGLVSKVVAVIADLDGSVGSERS